jgi:hypothetical protein
VLELAAFIACRATRCHEHEDGDARMSDALHELNYHDTPSPHSARKAP